MIRVFWFLVLFSFFLSLDVVSAQQGRVEGVDLEPIIVTSRRTPVGVGRVTENVTVIDEEQIKGFPARDLGEALKYIAGVDIQPRQGFGRPTSVSIQGADSIHVRVMIDGIPLNLLSSGQVNPARFSLENISRIEIIKGASSSLWGSALGGVVNIITKDTGNTLLPCGRVTSTWAEFRTKKESMDVSGKIGDLGYFFSSSYMESGGEGLKDDVLAKEGFAKLSYDLKDKGKIVASFGYNGGDVNSGLYPGGLWETNPYRCRYGKIGWENSFEKFKLGIDLKHSRQNISSKTFESVTSETPWLSSKSENIIYQLSLNSSEIIREVDLLVFGADFDLNILKSTRLKKAKVQRLQAPYLNYNLRLNPWDFNFGLRFDNNSEFGDDFSPSIGIIYHFKNALDSLVRANVSRAFNAPPLLWKYFDRDVSGSLTSNPGIEAERAWVYELGGETKIFDNLRVKLSLYRSDISDAIDNSINEAGLSYKANFKKFRRQGGEIQVEVDILEGLTLMGSGAYNDIEDKTINETVQDRLRQSFDVGIEYKNKKGLAILVKGYYDRWNMEADAAQPKDRKMLCDLKISQEFERFSLFLNVYNLTDSEYWSDYFFPVPERYFEGGITLKW
jgi:vitamin B12 transporter